MTKSRISKPDSNVLAALGYTLWIKGHSINTVSYPKSLRIQAFESLEAFKMYYAIGTSVSSLHRESIIICCKEGHIDE